MQRSFNLIEKFPDVVEAESGPEPPEIPNLHLERLARRLCRRLDQPAPERVVDDGAEGPSRSLGQGLELGRHVVVEGNRRAHTLMLCMKHHDVNGRPSQSRGPVAKQAGRLCFQGLPAPVRQREDQPGRQQEER